MSVLRQPNGSNKAGLTRRDFLSLTLASSTLAMLAACSAPAAPAATSAPAPAATAAPKPVATTAPAPAATAAPAVSTAAPVAQSFDWKKYSGTKLRYLGWNGPWSDDLAAKLPEFEQLTGIQVTWERLPQEQNRQKAMTEFTAKNKDLDLVFVAPDVDCVKYFKAGWLYPIDEYLASSKMMPPDFDLKDFAEGVMKTGNILGKQLVIPHQVDVAGFCYRKDLFAEKGLKPPETMDQIDEIFSKLHAPPNMYAFVSRGTAAQGPVTWAAYLYSFGGDWLTADRKPAISTPESIKAIEFWANLCMKYGPPGTTSLNWPESSAFVAQGKAAVEIDTTSRKSVYEDPKQAKVAGKMGYALFPKGPGGAKPWVWTAGTAISAYSEKKEAAWYFVLWTVSKQNQLFTQIKGTAAVRASAWKAPEMDAIRKATPDWIDTTLKTMEISDRPINPRVVAVMEYRNRVGEVLVKALQGLKGDALKAEAVKCDTDLAAIMAKTET